MKNSPMLWVGLTGGLASGKSTVAGLLRRRGIPVVDADELARKALSSGGPAFRQVVQKWGQDILDDKGEIRRDRLAEIVFKNAADRVWLEDLVHPIVRDQALKLRRDFEKAGQKVAFYDVPLLFEKNMKPDFDAVWVVSCSEPEQIRRAMARNGWTREQAMRRMAHQMSLTEKSTLADFLIENPVSSVPFHEHLERQIDQGLKQILPGIRVTK